MYTFMPVACLALLLPYAAAAATPTTETGPVEVGPSWIDVTCMRPALPAQQDFARLAGIANFGQAYALRNRAMVDVQRHCQKGTQAVRLVIKASGAVDRRVAVVAHLPR